MEPVIDSVKVSQKAGQKATVPFLRTTVLDGLAACLKDFDSGIRQRAVSALGVIGDLRSIDALETALNDADYPVRDSVAAVLSKTEAGELYY